MWLREMVPAAWVEAVDAGDAEVVRALAAGSEGAELHAAVAAEGWMTPTWPVAYGGRGLDDAAAAEVATVVRRWQIGHVNAAIGTAWIGPTLLEWGDEDQRRRYLPLIARNEELWCQLFSEPGAGSDLAAITTSVVPDGDRWIVNGQKVWTSRARLSRRGLLVARSDRTVPKHAGLTAFCLDMTSPGVEIRPLRQMTGDSEFFEVFLDNVSVPDADRIGPPGSGWAVCRSALARERVAGSGTGASPPGSVVGRSAAELLERWRGAAGPVMRQRLAAAWTEARVVELTNRRARPATAANGTNGSPGGSVPPAVTKVLQAEHTKRLQRLFIDLEGPSGVAWEEPDSWRRSNEWAFLRVQAKTIAGGTSEVLRSQIAERVLGLPREADPTRGVAWQDVAALYSGGRP